MYHIIVYRLHRLGQQYNELYKAIEGLGTNWHNTTSSWIVVSSLSPKKIFDRLKSHIDANDELAVFKLEGLYYGQLEPKDIRWLAERSGLRVSV